MCERETPDPTLLPVVPPQGGGSFFDFSHTRVCVWACAWAWVCAQRQWPEMEVERVRGVLERAATAEADGLLSYKATDTDRLRHHPDGGRAPQQRHATSTVPYAASELSVPVRLLTPSAHLTRSGVLVLGCADGVRDGR